MPVDLLANNDVQSEPVAPIDLLSGAKNKPAGLTPKEAPFENFVRNSLDSYINAPQEPVTYTSGSGFTQKTFTPEQQQEARKTMVSFGLGAVKLPLSRITNLYNDPEIQGIIRDHPLAAKAGETTRDLLLLKGLGLAFKGITVAPAISRLTDAISKVGIINKISQTTKIGKQFLNYYEIDRYARSAVTNGLVFGAWQALKEAGESKPDQNFLNSVANIGLTGAWGAGLGIATAVPNFVSRVAASGVYGAGTTLLAGGDFSDAAFNAALLSGFEIIGGKEIDNTIKYRAFNNIKEEGYQYLVRKGMNPFEARNTIETAMKNTVTEAGGIENILENNPATNMNYVASEMRKIVPSYKFTKPAELTYEPPAPEPAPKVETAPVSPVEPVAPTVSTDEALLAEARKYATPEEFVKSDYGAEPAAAIPGEPIEFIGAKGKNLDTAQAFIIEDEADNQSLGFKIQFKNGKILNNPKSDKIGGSPYFETSEEASNFAKSQLTAIWKQAHGEEVSKIQSEPTIPAVKPKKVTPERIKPDISGITPLQKEITQMEDREGALEVGQSMLDETNQVYTALEGALDKQGLSEKEIASIPKNFIAKKGGMLLPELISDIEEKAGVKFGTKGEFLGYMKNIVKTKKELESLIDVIKPQVISKRETTLLKEKIKAVETGIKEGKIQAKEEVKKVQEEIISTLEKMHVPKEDTGDFVKMMKNIQTADQLKKMLPSITARAQRLAEASDKRDINDNIKKELKTTRPVKKGARLAGKYEYEQNKYFDDLRRIHKLNQTKAQAELDAMPKEGLTLSDLIRLRFLSLKANGMSASLDLHKRVLEDIKQVKQIAGEAKTEADFIKLLNRAQEANDFITAVRSMKGDKDSAITKAENIYRRGFSNIYSMINSIAGPDLAKKYDPEMLQSDKEIAVFDKINDILDKSQEIFGVNGHFGVMSKIHDIVANEYKIIDSDGVETEITGMGLIDIHNAIKNDLIKERYFNAYGEEQINSLLSNLTPEEIDFADLLMEEVQQYRPILNQRNIEILGRDLGEVINYWPSTSEVQPIITDDIKMQGETPSAMKERSVSSKVIPVVKDAWGKFIKHVTEAEHINNLSRRYEELRRLFTDRMVKNEITKKFGKNVYQTLLDQIDNISLHREVARLDAISGVIGATINNWVKAKIALNPSILAKQLISLINYSEVMPVGEWAKGFTVAVLNPKDTFDFMWNNNGGFLQERFQMGYSEALKRAIDASGMLSKYEHNWAQGLSILARTGDIGAIIYGGAPYVRWRIAQGADIKTAFDDFRSATLKSQQSGLPASLSQFQNSSNPLARLFLAFKNTSFQYLRKQADAIISFRNGKINADELVKKITIYSIINPLLYALVGYGIIKGWKKAGEAITGMNKREKPSDDDLASSLLMQLAVNPFEAIPVFDDISIAIARRAAGKRQYKYLSTPLFDDIETAFTKLNKKNPTLLDYFQSFGTAVEVSTGLPIQTELRIYKYLAGNKGPLSTPVKKIKRDLGFK